MHGTMQKGYEILAGDKAAPVWVHHRLAPQGKPALVRDTYEPAAVKALQADETEPRFSRFNDVDILILRGINLAEGAEPEDMVSLRLAIRSDLIESVALRTVVAVDESARLVACGEIAARPGAIVVRLTERLTTRIKEAVVRVNRELKALEDALEEGDHETAGSSLAELRREVIWLHRFVEPQTEALRDLVEARPDWLTRKELLRLREIWHASKRDAGALETLRDHCQLLQDRIDQATATASRRTVYMLTVLAGVFLPLNLIASLVGANVGGVPLAQSDNGFLYLCLGVVALMALEVVLMRLLRWI